MVYIYISPGSLARDYEWFSCTLSRGQHGSHVCGQGACAKYSSTRVPVNSGAEERINVCWLDSVIQARVIGSED